MKFIFTLLTILTGSCLLTASCTDNGTVNNTASEPVEPGVYYVGMNLSAGETATKGVVDNNRFDQIYDYDYIYLHKITTDGTEESIRIPVIENCSECENNEKGIRYRICTFDDGTYNITALDENEKPDEGQMMSGITADDEFYFSSWSTDEWALSTSTESGDSQITEGIVDGQSTNFFHRKKEINQEIYRSENEYCIGEKEGTSNLIGNGDKLTIVRACAGFSVAGLFYDPSNVDERDPTDITYDITEETFSQVMESPVEEWYIKIYIGGNSFSNQHNIATGQSTGDKRGYYSSGDAAKYSEENIDTQIYLPFAYRTYKSGTTDYKGYGYYTLPLENEVMEGVGNYLFTPVTKEEMYVYILIKHWTKDQDPTGTSTQPSDDWLNSDEGALQTSVNLSQAAAYPENGEFFNVGLIMDIREFKNAWDDSADTATSAISTKSPSGATVREFTLKNAKVICEVY